MKMNGEKGQALPLVMIAIVLGALVIPPFLGLTGSSLIGSGIYTEAIHSQYATDSGAEHAIWMLTNTDLTENLTTPGQTISYSLPETINDLAANITISNSWQPIATDNFESGGWTGGTGWLDGWTTQGYADIVTNDKPFDGTHHLRLRGNNTFAKRSVDLTHQVGVHILVAVKVKGFEGNENGTCNISSDGVTWKTVHTWINDASTDDNEYHLYDIDISSYEMTSRFWISFNANMSGTGDLFYIDRLEVVWMAGYPIRAAYDDFETGNWTGGTGWTDNWTHSIASANVSHADPYQDIYHLSLSLTDTVRRSVDLSSYDMARLRFWYKIIGFKKNKDSVILWVSSDNVTWSKVKTWTVEQIKATYRFYDVNLASYSSLTSRFWIRFDCNSQNADRTFYIDNLEIVRTISFGITVQAGDSVLKAVMRYTGDNLTLISWYYA
jgi:hypothetical protein